MTHPAHSCPSTQIRRPSFPSIPRGVLQIASSGQSTGQSGTTAVTLSGIGAESLWLYNFTHSLVPCGHCHTYTVSSHDFTMEVSRPTSSSSGPSTCSGGTPCSLHNVIRTLAVLVVGGVGVFLLTVRRSERGVRS